MRHQAAVHGHKEPLRAASLRLRPPTIAGISWSFVYIFFTNGTPYDAPNRSETCPSR